MGYEAILFIGPSYKGHKGGIGAVLEVYASNISPFKFTPSFNGNYRAPGNLCLFVLCLIRVFFRLLTDRKIQIVHIHGASKRSFYRKYLLFLLAKYVFGKKVVYHMHGGRFRQFYEQSGRKVKSCIKHFINQADALVCLSKSWEVYFKSAFNPKLLLIVNNPIERVNDVRLERISTIEFLFLGKICDQKGVFDLLSIIQENTAAYRNKAVFRFGGNGETDRLEEFIGQNKLEGLVSFEGWVSGQLKHKLFSAANVYILPSYAEGLPMSVLEAMNYALPVISTKVGGIPEILQTGVNGFLVTPGDKTALKNAIDHFIDHPGDILKMGHQSRMRSGLFDIQAILPNLEALYIGLQGQHNHLLTKSDIGGAFTKHLKIKRHSD